MRPASIAVFALLFSCGVEPITDGVLDTTVTMQDAKCALCRREDAGAPSPRGDTIGLFSQARLVQLYAVNAQVAPSQFQFGQEQAAFQIVTPLAGDWNGDGADSAGFFDPRTAEFQLKNANGFGRSDVTFSYGVRNAKGFSGDFDGDGTDTVGWFSAGTFHLRNSNTPGPDALTFSFGQGSVPLFGDWDGDGDDTVGIYQPATGRFMLRNSNDSGPAVVDFVFGPPNQLPLAGDWNGDGKDDVGVYSEEEETLTLKGATDTVVRLPHVEWTRMPVAGRWATPAPPVELGFDWPTDTPENQNIDAARLDAAFVKAGKLQPTLSLLVLRNGKLVREQYWHGANRSVMTNVKSVTKSFMSALSQVAMDQGLMQRNDTLSTLLPEYADDSRPPQIRNITLQELLDMRAGLNWDDTGDLGRMIQSNDWIDFALDQGVSPGGKVFHYNLAPPHMVAAALAKRVPQPLPDWANQQLLGPMGVTAFRWDREPFRWFVGGCETFFVPRDMARLGELYRSFGVLDGRRIISESGVRYITTGGGNYRSYWWLGNTRGYSNFHARGHGGQRIWVIRALQLVVVATSKANVTDDESDAQAGALDGLFMNDIVPSVRP